MTEGDVSNPTFLHTALESAVCQWNENLTHHGVALEAAEIFTRKESICLRLVVVFPGKGIHDWD